MGGVARVVLSKCGVFSVYGKRSCGAKRKESSTENGKNKATHERQTEAAKTNMTYKNQLTRVALRGRYRLPTVPKRPVAKTGLNNYDARRLYYFARPNWP